VCHSFWRGDGDVSFDGKVLSRWIQGKLHTPLFANGRSTPKSISPVTRHKRNNWPSQRARVCYALPTRSRT
jgi:hypothetical protein